MQARKIPLPAGWTPYAVAGDAAGDVWMTLLSPAGLGRLAPGDGGTRHEELPDATGQPMLLSAGADGAIWYSATGDRLGRRDPAGGHTVVELAEGSAPYGIAATGDGGAWFASPGTDQLGRVTADGRIAPVALPPRSRAAGLAVGTDGTVWAALNGAGALALVRDGAVQVVELPDGRATAAPVGVAACGDGVWYADIAGGCVGRVDAAGRVEQVTLADPGCRPHAVADAGDGGCWVTLWGSGELARVSAGGDVTTWPLPGREPHGLWVSDSAVWVAMESGSLAVVDRGAPS